MALKVTGNWATTSSKLKQRWSNLTESDLAYVEGQEEQLIQRVMARTSQTHTQAETAIRDACVGS